MRSPVRRLQDIWFCNVTEVNEGIDLVKEYSKPEKHRFTVSATMGYVRGWAAGWSLQYDRYITCYERDFKPTEGTMCFVDVIPQVDENGNLIQVDVPEFDIDGVTPLLDENDEPVTHKEYLTEPDYMIQRILDTKKGIVARFVITKV